MYTENRKRNEPLKFRVTSEAFKLNLKDPNKIWH